MKIAEELFCFCFMCVSSIALLYDLGSESVVTVDCVHAKTFCLKALNHDSSVRYTLTAKNLDVKCNTQGLSIWLRLLVFSGIFFNLSAFAGAIYVYYNNIRVTGLNLGEIFQRFAYATVSITGLSFGLFIVLPFVTYVFPVGGASQRGIFEEMWVFLPKGVGLLILRVITAPFRLVVHNQFKIELGLDRVYENFTCVEPIMAGDGVLRCPMESFALSGMPEPTSCQGYFYCTRDCYVAFPRIVINSLSFIFASFALCSRLLTLTQHITSRESGVLTHDDRCSAISLKSRDEIACSKGEEVRENILDESLGGDMKDKCVARALKPAAGSGARQRYDCTNSPRNVRKRGENNESAGAKQSREKGKLNEVSSFKETGSEIIDSVEILNGSSEEHESLANGRKDTEFKISVRNSQLKESETKLLSSSSTTVVARRFSSKRQQTALNSNADSLSNGAAHSQQKPQRRTRFENSQGKTTRVTRNGHVEKELKVYRRGAKIDINKTSNKTELPEVKIGLTGTCNGIEEHEEPGQWSSSEDLVDGIECLLVEDESEFFMSGFRL